MYQLRFNDEIIYDPRGANEIDGLIIRDPKIELGVGRAGSVKFTIGNDHPHQSALTRMHGRLELLDDGEPIFRGRIIRDKQTFRLNREIEAEGVLACLNDSVVEPYSFPEDYSGNSAYNAAAASGNVVEFWLGRLLTNHNAQVATEQQIKLGTVTVSDPNNYIARSNDKYSTTWQTVTEKLSGSSLGGYLIIRYEDDGDYLDYLEDLPRANIQKVEFGKNLLDYNKEVYGGDLFTVIIPIGKDGLTIASLPDGTVSGTLVKSGKTIYDSEAVATYGRITKVVEWNDVTEAANLRTKAAAELRAGISMPVTVECKACDLHGTDGNIPSFRVGQYVEGISLYHDISALYPLLELKPDIFDPSNTEITMGRTKRTFTDYMRESAQAAQDTSGHVSRVVSRLTDDVSNVASEAQNAQSAAESAQSAASANSADITQLRADYAALVVRVSQLEGNS